VGRAHGLEGGFYVTGARPRLLGVGAKLRIGERTLPIVRRAGVPERPIVHVEGVEDRSAAEALRGLDLWVSSAEVLALEEGEYWAHELEGCVLFDGARRLGRVVGLVELPSCEALEVLTEEGEELLVPMVRDAIRGIDTGGRRIEIDSGFLGDAWR
jgi:16S rRNA processing protein RimM